MADNRFFELLSGTVTLTVHTGHPEQLLNLAMARGVHIFDIAYRPEGVRFKLRVSALAAMESMAEEFGFELEYHGVAGMPVYKRVFRQRLGFVAGMVFFLIALWLMAAGVWSIEVTGNEQVDAERIIASAARHGLCRGAMRWEFDRKQVEEGVLRDIPQLSYLEIRQRGVQAEIMVVEKVLPGEDERSPAHVVARRDGVIAEVLTLAGAPLVTPGQTVVAGQVLISGIIMPTVSERVVQTRPLPTEPQIVRARGVVRARVWYEGYGECARWRQDYGYTGEERRRLYAVNGERRWCLWGGRGEEFALADSVVRRLALPFSGGKLALELEREREQSVQAQSLSEREAFEVAREIAIDQLRQYCSEVGEVRASSIDLLSEPDAEVVKVKLVIEVLEEIGRVQMIEAAEQPL